MYSQINANKRKSENAHSQDKKYQEKYEKQQKLHDVMQAELYDKNAAKKEENIKKEKHKKKCDKASKELQDMKDARSIYIETDDPNNPRFLTDEERKAEEGKYEKYIKKYC